MNNHWTERQYVRDHLKSSKVIISFLLVANPFPTPSPWPNHQEIKEKRNRDSNHTESVNNCMLPIKDYVQKCSHNESYTKIFNSQNTYLTHSKVIPKKTHILQIPEPKSSWLTKSWFLPGTKGIVASVLVPSASSPQDTGAGQLWLGMALFHWMVTGLCSVFA